jgi:hypothetical protein
VARTRNNRIARKNMDMDTSKLRRARVLLGARTETETVDRALDLVLFQADLDNAIDRLAAVGGLDDPYDDGRSVTSTRRRREPKPAD